MSTLPSISIVSSRRILVALLLFSGVRQVTAQADSLQRERVLGHLGARLDSALRRFEAQGFAGSVLVVRGRQVVLLKGYGMADIAHSIRNTPATRFEMNSMTKMLTAVSILQLAAAGRIDLDASLERYFGPFPTNKRSATVRQLASHTAGLVVAGATLAGSSRDAFVADMKQATRETEAGTAYRYSNAGYSLLAALVEIASGQRFRDYLTHNVFAPAGMSTALFRDEVPARDPLYAHGYVAGADGKPVPGPANPYVWGTIGAGGVWSTVGDIYRWVVAVEDSVVIHGAQRSLLFQTPTPPSQEEFGWHVRAATDSSRRQIDKGGGSADFASQLIYFPDDHVTIIWANNNLTQRWRQKLNRALVALTFAVDHR